MHLKNLTLRGFKSFASTTTLKLEPGITCVVGPNGSGKSNVVDALAWVMGEQGAKSLRGSNMSDVIFAGTSGRPALGRAQIDLTIDNSDGALPIEYTEVTITRTLFRGGGSEYAINGSPARLLDIQELLSDTGMGRQMHVIVGQGRLDSILQATPEDRRGFIEEAAGVLKHRRRKERALKKLADMDQNLVRVLDLTEEIRRQLGPLARQAKQARKASLIQARVRDAKARLLADDLVNVREKLERQSHIDTRLEELKRAHETKIADLRASIEESERNQEARARNANDVTRVWQEATSVHERAKTTLAISAERVKQYSRPEATPTGEDPDVLDQRALAASNEDGDLLQRVQQAQRELSSLVRAKEQAEDEDQRAAKELARVNALVADHREKVARLTGDVGSAHARLEAGEAEAGRARSALEAALARAEEAKKAVEDAPEESGGDFDVSRAHAQAGIHRDQARAKVDALLAAEREARADRAHWEARRDALTQLLARDDDTAHLLDRDHVLGAVQDFVNARQGTENAIATLLGPFADAVVMDSLDSALTQARDAQESNSGQLRMMIANGDEVAPAKQKLPEGLTWARECVTPDPKVAASVSALLCGTVVANDLDAAQRGIAIDTVDVAVTLSGTMVTRSGVIAAGQTADSLLAIKAQHEAAATKAEAAQHTCDALSDELTAANTALDLAIRGANEALKALRAHDALQAERAQKTARLQSALAASEAEVGRGREALKRAEDHVEWAKERVEEARSKVETLSESPSEDVDAARDKAEGAARTAKEAREAETSARLALRALEEQSRQAGARARNLRQAAAKEREERGRYAKREAQRQVALRAATEIEADARQAVNEAAQLLAIASARQTAVAEETRQENERVGALRLAVDEEMKRLADVTGEVQRDEIARTQLELQASDVERRAMEELALDADTLIEEYGPHTLVPVFPSDPDEEVSEEGQPFVRSEQEKAFEKASNELVRLGRVNPLALEEHDALAARHAFLMEQVKDLKESKADLMSIITDVDRLVEEAFVSAFEDTKKQFAHTFDVLFPGGTGDLILTDPDSPLTTGIEIEARPAGKKVKRMSLLSGGERSLAAIAFLVAIFKARPSPFYVMDEVEAALDDVNLSRLLAIFKELREESQLIVITHQKRTMEIADALYGVSMRDGVTGVVSQRLARS